MNYVCIEVLGSVGPRLLVGGTLGLLDFVLCALWMLRPCDPHLREGEGEVEEGLNVHHVSNKSVIKKNHVRK